MAGSKPFIFYIDLFRYVMRHSAFNVSMRNFFPSCVKKCTRHNPSPGSTKEKCLILGHVKNTPPLAYLLLWILLIDFQKLIHIKGGIAMTLQDILKDIEMTCRSCDTCDPSCVGSIMKECIRSEIENEKLCPDIIA